MFKTAIVATAAVFCASSALAQNFSGNLGFSYAAPTDSDDQSVTEYFGGIEYAFNRNFSVGLDLTGYDFEDIDAATVSSTWHFIYHYDDATSVSLFAGADVIADDTDAGVVSQDLTFAGLEAGSEFGVAEAEGYVGFATTDGDADDFTMFGVQGEYDLSSGFSAVGSADFLTSDSFDANNLSIGVEYEFSGGPELYGKLGRRSAELDGGVDDDSNYIELGASVSFGADRGTTFQRRSVFEILPNF